MQQLYEDPHPIGQGGMGVVQRARHRYLGRYVAIKEIKPEAIREREFRDRFDREAKSAARLYHQNVVAIHDYWVTDHSMAIVMEYVDGISARNLIAAHRRIAPPIAAYIAREAAKGLAYVHKMGLVHRDVKCSNLLISRDGEVKISDFGIVKDDAPSDLTRTGDAIGTPHYMSPEQLEGRHADVDGRSDVFALGVCLYEMLSGAFPCGEGTASSVAARVIAGKATPLRRLNADVP